MYINAVHHVIIVRVQKFSRSSRVHPALISCVATHSSHISRSSINFFPNTTRRSGYALLCNIQMSHIQMEEANAGSRRYQEMEGGSIQRGGGIQQPTRENDMKFSYIAGVVDAIDRTRFERQLFRTMRGNCYVRFAEIEQAILDPVTGESVMKLVFIIFYKVGNLPLC